MSGPDRPFRNFPLRLDRLAGVHGTATSAPASAAVERRAVPRTVLRPQQPLQHAVDAALRRRPLEGIGLDSAGVRQRMVDRLRAGGIRHGALLDAMAHVPRHVFVDTALISQAYEDTSLPIGHGQTISKPSVIARMIELLTQGPNAARHGHLGRSLEIGSGCGYQAAVLAQLSRRLVSVERLKPLHDRARLLLNAQRVGDVRLVFGDGMQGHAPNAPYDSIIAAAGGDVLPQAWLDQLAVGGRLVAPVGNGAGRQALVVADRTEHGWHRQQHECVQFVPLKSGVVT